MENKIDEIEISTIKMFENYPDILSIEDLQKALGIGRNQAYSLIQENIIKSFKIGRIHKIPKVNLIRYIMNFQNVEV